MKEFDKYLEKVYNESLTEGNMKNISPKKKNSKKPTKNPPSPSPKKDEECKEDKKINKNTKDTKKA